MPMIDPATITASIAAYLEELRESGIDGLPEETAIHCAAAEPAPRELQHQPPPPSDDLPPAATRHETLEAIRKQLGDCQRCKLGKTRKQLVFGTGNPHSRILFVGEGPGADEDASGEPFVGEAGKILTRIITAMGLTREAVYICNVVKCRPPGNRNPEDDEIEACSPFLLRQVDSIKPEVIVALGKFASHTLLNSKEPISKLRGKFHDYHGVPLMPTFHPSYLLHNREDKGLFWDVWDDMTQVLRLLGLPVPDKSRK